MTAAETLPVLALCFALAAASPVERGRAIYEKGGDVSAVMGDGVAPVPASLMPCASCHGADGRGRAEGGVVPPDIRHAALTRPYEVTASSGRRHGPYDDRSLLRAIAMGVDPAGNPLNNVMPRYQLSRGDAASLLAYLAVLGDGGEPGVTADEVTIAALVPDDAREPLRNWAAVLNASGGVFGRRIALRFDGSLDHFLDGALAAIADRVDEPLAAQADRDSIPLLATLTPHPVGATHRMVFDLFPGIDDQARALIRDAAKSPLLIVGGDAAIADEAKQRGIAITSNEAEAESILVLMPSAVPRTHARLLVPAALTTAATFDADTFVAFPLLPSSRSPHADAAVAAATLLADALRHAGRDVSRATLAAALDDATHHVRPSGAYVVELDHGRASEPRWVP